MKKKIIRKKFAIKSLHNTRDIGVLVCVCTTEINYEFIFKLITSEWSERKFDNQHYVVDEMTIPVNVSAIDPSIYRSIPDKKCCHSICTAKILSAAHVNTYVVK